jgi:hypothetical protein
MGVTKYPYMYLDFKSEENLKKKCTQKNNPEKLLFFFTKKSLLSIRTVFRANFFMVHFKSNIPSNLK